MRHFDYWQEAQRCREAAGRASSAQSRVFMETMARVWEQIAGDTVGGKPKVAAEEARAMASRRIGTRS